MQQAQRFLKMLPLILLLVLSACGRGEKGGTQLALDVRRELQNASGLSLTADVTADYGKRTYQFTVDYKGTAELGALTITAPDSIAGITAKVDLSRGSMTFDGATLDTGPLTGDGLSPAEAIPVLYRAWLGGDITGSWFERLGDSETLVVTTAITDSVTQRTWFNKTTHLPVRSEIMSGGRTVIMGTFRSVTRC